MTTPDPGNSDKRGAPEGRDPVDKPDLRKQTDPTPPSSSAENTSETTHEFGRTFDYDATAQASLSEQSPTPESLGGSVGTPGPGWDTYSGVGNGPGWGTTPSYPPPSENLQSDYPAPGSAEFGAGAPHSYPSAPQQGYTPPQYGAQGPVYGTPDPQYPTGGTQYPTGGAPGYPLPNEFGVSPDPYGGQPYGAYGPPPGYGPPAGYVDPSAPYGRDPYTGEPYSDKSKVTAGILEILLGAFGAGRFYLDQPGIAIAQIAVTWLTCGIGGIWPLIDGILMLTGKVRDNHGRPLQP
ncbi:NINE protein [Rhodococcus sp. NPDC060086]|uniref:NINE protein n=1 Tax=Rhodococcus sp. NPDC060086 TaxID=3347055 RepID=UPI0036631041